MFLVHLSIKVSDDRYGKANPTTESTGASDASENQREPDEEKSDGGDSEEGEGEGDWEEGVGGESGENITQESDSGGCGDSTRADSCGRQDEGFSTNEPDEKTLHTLDEGEKLCRRDGTIRGDEVPGEEKAENNSVEQCGKVFIQIAL